MNNTDYIIQLNDKIKLLLTKKENRENIRFSVRGSEIEDLFYSCLDIIHKNKYYIKNEKIFDFCWNLIKDNDVVESKVILCANIILSLNLKK
jgi:hypothetical protein